MSPAGAGWVPLAGSVSPGLGGTGAARGCAAAVFAQLSGGVSLWHGGLERGQMFEPKNVHYCIKLLMAARVAAPGPLGKPQSLNYAPEIAFGRAAVIWRFIFLFQLAGSPPS